MHEECEKRVNSAYFFAVFFVYENGSQNGERTGEFVEASWNEDPCRKLVDKYEKLGKKIEFVSGPTPYRLEDVFNAFKNLDSDLRTNDFKKGLAQFLGFEGEVKFDLR